jgi:hypothetical protein
MARILSEDEAKKLEGRRGRPILKRLNLYHPLWPWLAAVLGFISGPLFAFLPFINLESWQPFPHPPEQATELLGYKYSDQVAYVRTRSDQIYACTYESHCEPIDLLFPHRMIDYPDNYGIRSTPKPPGTTIASLQYVDSPSPDNFEQTNVILLDDGTLWLWRGYKSEFDNFFLAIFVAFSCVFISPILALIFGVLTYSLQRIFKNTSLLPGRSALQ